MGKPIDANASYELKTNGYAFNSHSARQLDDRMLQQADLVLVMEIFQQQRLMAEYPAASGKVMLLGKWLNNLEINDPYGKSAEAFSMVFKQLEQACEIWSEKLGGKE